jgi:uncharacterized DUF497 family protein
MIRFEWDSAKEQANRRKHRVSFEIARHVFEDTDALVEQDRIEDGEVRWQTIGMIHGALLLLVAHTVAAGDDESDDTIRIISARRASRRERRRYEKERQKNYS